MIEYDIIQKPPCGRSEESAYYVVPVYGPTFSVRQLADNIEQATSLTAGDVQAAVTALTDELVRALAEGNRVRIDGLGTFRLRITTPKKQLRANDNVGKKIEARDVDFTPDRELMRRFVGLSFVRTRQSRALRRVVTGDALLAKLRLHFSQQEFVRRADVELLAQCGSTKAKALLRTLEEAGYLINAGTLHAPAYRATPLLTEEAE